MDTNLPVALLGGASIEGDAAWLPFLNLTSSGWSSLRKANGNDSTTHLIPGFYHLLSNIL